MAGTRRSARVASSQGSQGSSPPAQSSPNSAGKKRKAESGTSPSAKRGKTAPKEQKTIEESMDIDKDTTQQPQPENKDEKSQGEKTPRVEEEPKAEDKPEVNKEQPSTDQEKDADKENQPQSNGHAKSAQEMAPKESAANTKHESNDPEDKNDSNDTTSKQEEKTEDEHKPATNGDDAVEPEARDDQVPSSILEKGILYFVYRGRVNIDDPKEVQDLARSYIVMRPLPHGAKLGDGPIGDDNNCRLLAVPKKTLPLTGNDKWTAFVEKANVSFKDLKEGFLKSNDYDTSTQGAQHTPPVTPAAEGVYAITTTGRESHLAYIVTLPAELGEVQKDLGIRERGSFITSVKNPKAPGPASANLGSDPGYSSEIMNEFRSLRWAPLQPKHLNYESCQFLMIGEGEDGLTKATEPQKEDTKNDKDEPKEEMEKLEDEDEVRVKHLDGDDAIFADLGTDSKSYPALQTTW